MRSSTFLPNLELTFLQIFLIPNWSWLLAPLVLPPISSDCSSSTVPSSFLLYVESKFFGIEHGHSHGHSHSQASTPAETTSIVSEVATGNVTPTQKLPISKRKRSLSHSSALIHSPTESFSSLYGHPAATRASLVQTANEMASARSPSPTARRVSASHPRHSYDLDRGIASETIDEAVISLSSSNEGTPLLQHEQAERSHVHPSGDGHSHAGSMNMRALVLHVLGDALGNVGVIATGLIIWKTSWPFKYYFDPIISLVITIIIFSSALPLGK